MTAKKKTENTEAAEKVASGDAFEKNENPKRCRSKSCKSTGSKIVGHETYESIGKLVTFRECNDCGEGFSTITLGEVGGE